MARSDDYYKRLLEEEQKVKDIGDFSYNRQADYDAARDKILNRDKFKFDMNNNALYKQYKDQYAALGKLAMQDTMGQASAMTGGYGNSYATTAGQQMYQQYMQKSNDMLPELYSMALDRYNAEGNALQNNYSILNSDRNEQYALWQDAYNRALAERDYANSQFANERAYELSQRKSSGGGGGRGSSGNGNGNESGKTVYDWINYLPTFDDYRSSSAQSQYSSYDDYMKAMIHSLYVKGKISGDTAAELYEHYQLTDENEKKKEEK